MAESQDVATLEVQLAEARAENARLQSLSDELREEVNTLAEQLGERTAESARATGPKRESLELNQVRRGHYARSPAVGAHSQIGLVRLLTLKTRRSGLTVNGTRSCAPIMHTWALPVKEMDSKRLSTVKARLAKRVTPLFRGVVSGRKKAPATR